ncbi:ATP-binding protein [Paenibacillus sp. FSL M8-0334]|uniref:histidine kinase n=1 Tax=Paenibacillus campinasensis TaxID=66347 RepID=A0ABW9T3M5_9BACL|nr:sensor histidine kinase [Paenibacillus campinasensis]MUG67905.1 sensor histidine kinase [Paenibacillus campinasensis]
MKSRSNTLILMIAILIMTTLCGSFASVRAESADFTPITEWSILWSDEGGQMPLGIPDASEPGWTDRREAPDHMKPSASHSAWIRLQLPAFDSLSQGILIRETFGQRVAVYAGHEKIYESSRSYNYELNHILLPLPKSMSDNNLYIWLDTNRDHVMLEGKIMTGEFYRLLQKFVKANLADIVLGSAFIFIALVMLICILFLNKKYLSGVFSLSLIILSVGIVVITYSPFLYTIFDEYGHLYTHLYDISLFVLLPSFSHFFETVFGPGRNQILTKLRKFQIVYSLFCVLLLVINSVADNRFFDMYYFFSVQVLGYLMIIQFVILVGSSTMYAFKGNKDALIFNIGFAFFALLGLAELLQFFMSRGAYSFVLWKWGVVSFIIALIVMLGRQFAQNHEQILKYSKELEMFNNQLQRSEKVEMISELAASVAHEVRNPLQVTRGFLQLLSGRSRTGEQEYLDLALTELDRAAGIITDFLTFAKPELGKDSLLQIAEEFKLIEGILAPLANLRGGRISVDVPEDLVIRGNSSKFKQAFINIIKNSIEALDKEGRVHICSYRDENKVYIHVQDNGEGMEEEVLARLGEPYFSNKTKGTGLGLMVTFRIIEAMGGSIHFSSKKGVGTAALVMLPAASD